MDALDEILKLDESPSDEKNTASKELGHGFGPELAEALASLVPIDFWHPKVNGGRRFTAGYSAIVHRKVCQLAMLGFTDSSIAKSVGVSSGTLASWKRKYPWLATDLERYRAIGVAAAASKLRELMEGSPEVAFEAVRFFLERRSEEFSTKKTAFESEAAREAPGMLKSIISDLYGV
ncbi:MAG: hypothetical protein KIPDCIKN_04355 [Haliscomenobacter sp.]|nr:hypothetical protein [Haliscomenobacter sp.]